MKEVHFAAHHRRPCRPVIRVRMNLEPPDRRQALVVLREPLQCRHRLQRHQTERAGSQLRLGIVVDVEIAQVRDLVGVGTLEMERQRLRIEHRDAGDLAGLQRRLPGDELANLLRSHELSGVEPHVRLEPDRQRQAVGRLGRGFGEAVDGTAVPSDGHERFRGLHARELRHRIAGGTAAEKRADSHGRRPPAVGAPSVPRARGHGDTQGCDHAGRRSGASE
jgi:hypothetical protein